MSHVCMRCGIRFLDTESTKWCPATDCTETKERERPRKYEGAGAAHVSRPVFSTVHFRDQETYERWTERKYPKD